MLGKIELPVEETDKLFLPIRETNFRRRNTAKCAGALAQCELRRGGTESDEVAEDRIVIGRDFVTDRSHVTIPYSYDQPIGVLPG